MTNFRPHTCHPERPLCARYFVCRALTGMCRSCTSHPSGSRFEENPCLHAKTQKIVGSLPCPFSSGISWLRANPCKALRQGQKSDVGWQGEGTSSALVVSGQPLVVVSSPLIRRAFSHRRPPGPVTRSKRPARACGSPPWWRRSYLSWPLSSHSTF